MRHPEDADARVRRAHDPHGVAHALYSRIAAELREPEWLIWVGGALVIAFDGARFIVTTHDCDAHVRGAVRGWRERSRRRK